MKTTARVRTKNAKAPARSPLSVTLTPDLRRRLSGEAKKRKLKVATTARVLLDERINEIEDEAQLQRAEKWQIEQAWATWDKIQAGDRRWVTVKQLEEVGRRALEKARRKARARAG